MNYDYQQSNSHWSGFLLQKHFNILVTLLRRFFLVCSPLSLSSQSCFMITIWSADLLWKLHVANLCTEAAICLCKHISNFPRVQLLTQLTARTRRMLFVANS